MSEPDFNELAISDDDIQTAIDECLGDASTAVMHLANRFFGSKPLDMTPREYTDAVQMAVQNFVERNAS